MGFKSNSMGLQCKSSEMRASCIAEKTSTRPATKSHHYTMNFGTPPSPNGPINSHFPKVPKGISSQSGTNHVQLKVGQSCASIPFMMFPKMLPKSLGARGITVIYSVIPFGGKRN